MAGREQALVLLPLERLAEEREQARGRDDGDVRAQRLGNLRALVLLAASARVRVARVEVGLARQPLEPGVPRAVRRAQFDHGLGALQDLARGVELAQLDQLEHQLLVQVRQQRKGQLERAHHREDALPVALLHVGDEGVDVVDGVERDLRLVLQRLQRARQRRLLEELQHEPHHVGGLHLHVLPRV